MVNQGRSTALCQKTTAHRLQYSRTCSRRQYQSRARIQIHFRLDTDVHDKQNGCVLTKRAGTADEATQVLLECAYPGWWELKYTLWRVFGRSLGFSLLHAYLEGHKLPKVQNTRSWSGSLISPTWLDDWHLGDFGSLSLRLMSYMGLVLKTSCWHIFLTQDTWNWNQQVDDDLPETMRSFDDQRGGTINENSDGNSNLLFICHHCNDTVVTETAHYRS